MGNSTSFAIIAAGLCTVLAVFVRQRTSAQKHDGSPFPPGPKPLPLIGNVKELPTSFQWETFAEWSKTYGDVMLLKAFNVPILLLSSARAANDLLEKRSNIYSCRPKFTMIHDLMGWNWAVQFMQFGPRFKKHRKAVLTQLTPQAVRSLRPTIEASTNSLIENIKLKPNAFLEHVHHMTGEMMITAIYGEQDASSLEAQIHRAEEAIGGLVTAGNFGTFLVDIIPFLKYIPDWFPGASFQRKAEMWRNMARDMIEIPYEESKKSFHAGSTEPSIVHSMLSVHSVGPIDEELVKGTAGVLYLGGADTMLSILYTFIFAMLLHPEVQERAQKEIDETLGFGKRPTLDDKSSLPYIQCIYYETLRWHPAVPLGVPHRLMEEDTYRGFRIPVGATVLVNQWAIFRDETTYKNASAFDPDRFSSQEDPDKAILDPSSVAFGFGRRQCPGRHFADDAVWLVMASILAEFSVAPTADESGRPVIPPEKFISSMISRPEPFAANFKPRRRPE